MSSSSESEEDEFIKNLQDAADFNLFPITLYQKQNSCPPEVNSLSNTSKAEVLINNEGGRLKSQRYLEEDDANYGVDIAVSKTTQAHFSKKLSKIIEQTFKFVDYPNDEKRTKKSSKSRVKLLKDADCYVKSFEDNIDEISTPQFKPTIARRNVDSELIHDEDKRISTVALSGEDILSGIEMKYWAKKPIRHHKIFEYKLNKFGDLFPLEKINEFTAMRRKNNWSESKIKTIKDRK